MLIENRLKVSLWIAPQIGEGEFHEYAVETDRETDGPANAFARDLGTYSVDPDFLDGKYSKKILSVDKLLQSLASAATFAEAAMETANGKGIESAHAVLAVYQHEYRGSWPKRSPLTFLGSFDYFPDPRRGAGKSGAATTKDFCYLEYDVLRNFWAIELRGTKHIIRSGPIGLSGKEQVREFDDKEKARKEYEKAIKAKEKAGYEVRPGSPPKKRGKN
jgi:predicted DNA-binding WGR domain protein